MNKTKNWKFHKLLKLTSSFIFCINLYANKQNCKQWLQQYNLNYSYTHLCNLILNQNIMSLVSTYLSHILY